MTYTDKLRKVKNEPDLKDVGQHVHGIKRTAKGELLLILENAADPNTQNYCSILQWTLGESVEVKTLAETVLIEIRDLDEVSISPWTQLSNKLMKPAIVMRHGD